MNRNHRPPVALASRVAAFCLLLASAVAAAHEYYAAGFTFIHPWADATAPGATSAPVYFRLDDVRAADRLLRADSPHAESVELRGGSDASAPALKAIDVAPAATLDFGADRPHLLLRGLKTPLQWGRSYQMTVVFERAGPIQVMVSIGAH